MQLRFLSSSLAAFAAVAVLGLPSLAHAEAGRAPPRCEVSVAPNNSTLVPSNIPAIVASPTARAEGFQRVTLTAFDAEAGRSFADTVERVQDSRVPGATLFVPTATLPEGTSFEAGFTVECSGIASEPMTRFATKGPAELPTQIGSITTRAGTTVNAAQIFVDATPELLAFLPVTMFEISTRTGVVIAAGYGAAQLGEDGRVVVSTPSTFPFPVNLCGDGAEGTHLEDMELRAHVAGAEIDPTPVAFQMAISCQTATVAAPSTAKLDEESTDAGGCAASPDPAPAPWTAFVSGVLAVVAMRRRRAVKATSAR